ncbi:hypothetical protein P7K49_012854, partial [Saguinus oedipus]
MAGRRSKAHNDSSEKKDEGLEKTTRKPTVLLAGARETALTVGSLQPSGPSALG